VGVDVEVSDVQQQEARFGIPSATVVPAPKGV
jgi:hypothetical protein